MKTKSLIFREKLEDPELINKPEGLEFFVSQINNLKKRVALYAHQNRGKNKPEEKKEPEIGDEQAINQKIEGRINYINTRLDQTQKFMMLSNYLIHHLSYLSNQYPAIKNQCIPIIQNLEELKVKVEGVFSTMDPILLFSDLFAKTATQGASDGDFYDLFLNLIHPLFGKNAGQNNSSNASPIYQALSNLNRVMGGDPGLTDKVSDLMDCTQNMGNIAYYQSKDIIIGNYSSKIITADACRNISLYINAQYIQCLDRLRNVRSNSDLDSGNMMKDDLFGQAINTPELFEEIIIRQPSISFSQPISFYYQNSSDFNGEGVNLSVSIGKYETGATEDKVVETTDEDGKPATYTETFGGQQIWLRITQGENIHYYKKFEIRHADGSSYMLYVKQDVNTTNDITIGEPNFGGLGVYEPTVFLHEDFEYAGANPGDPNGNYVEDLMVSEYKNLLDDNIPFGRLILDYFQSLISNKVSQDAGEGFNYFDYFRDMCADNGDNLISEIYDYIEKYITENCNCVWLVQSNGDKEFIKAMIKKELNHFHDPISLLTTQTFKIDQYQELYESINRESLESDIRKGFMITQLLGYAEAQSDPESITNPPQTTKIDKSTIATVEQYATDYIEGKNPTIPNILSGLGEDTIAKVQQGYGLSTINGRITLSEAPILTDQVIDEQIVLAKEPIINMMKQDFMHQVFIGTLEGYNELRPGSVTGNNGLQDKYPFLRIYNDITGVGYRNPSDSNLLLLQNISEQIVLQIVIIAISGGVGNAVAAGLMAGVGRGLSLAGQALEAAKLASFGERLWFAYKLGNQAKNFAILGSGVGGGTRLLNLGVRAGEYTISGTAFHMTRTLINDGLFQQHSAGEVRSTMIDMRENLHSIALLATLGALKMPLNYMTRGLEEGFLKTSLASTLSTGNRAIINTGGKIMVEIPIEILAMYGIDRSFNLIYDDAESTKWTREYFVSNLEFILGLRLSGYYTKFLHKPGNEKIAKRIEELEAQKRLGYKITEKDGRITIRLVELGRDGKIKEGGFDIVFFEQSKPATGEQPESLVDKAETLYNEQGDRNKAGIPWSEVAKNRNGLTNEQRILKIKQIFIENGVDPSLLTYEVLDLFIEIHENYNIQETRDGKPVRIDEVNRIPKLKLSALMLKVTELEKIFERLKIAQDKRKILRDRLIRQGLLGSDSPETIPLPRTKPQYYANQEKHVTDPNMRSSWFDNKQGESPKKQAKLEAPIDSANAYRIGERRNPPISPEQIDKVFAMRGILLENRRYIEFREFEEALGQNANALQGELGDKNRVSIIDEQKEKLPAADQSNSRMRVTDLFCQTLSQRTGQHVEPKHYLDMQGLDARIKSGELAGIKNIVLSDDIGYSGSQLADTVIGIQSAYRRHGQVPPKIVINTGYLSMEAYQRITAAFAKYNNTNYTILPPITDLAYSNRRIYTVAEIFQKSYPLENPNDLIDEHNNVMDRLGGSPSESGRLKYNQTTTYTERRIPNNTSLVNIIRNLVVGEPKPYSSPGYINRTKGRRNR